MGSFGGSRGGGEFGARGTQFQQKTLGWAVRSSAKVLSIYGFWLASRRAPTGQTMIASAHEINSALLGFTEVMEVCLVADLASSSYRLSLTLADSEHRSMLLVCSDVSSLSLPEFGGGLNQFTCLRAEDVRHRQLGRVAFHFADLENHAIAFDCSSARVEAVGSAAHS